MARKLRLEYPGAIYHVMNRGDRRQAIFKHDTDRELFFSTLTEVCDKTRWQVHAYCLMDNHFHLVLHTPDANLVAGMKWFLGTYTSRFNRRLRSLAICLAVGTKSSASHYGEIVWEAAQARAEQIVIAGLKRLKWRETELAVRRKGNPDKVKLALALRAQTTMPLRWIAARLCMGTPGYLKWLLYQARQKK